MSFLDALLLCPIRAARKGLKMFANVLQSAIDAARPYQFEHLSRQLWQAHAAGHIEDDAAQSLAERLQRRRSDGGVAQGALFALPAPNAGAAPQRAWPGFARSREQRSPDRQRSIARRRRLAASGPMPPAMACGFTVGELAVLRIIGDEVMAHGTCDRSLAEIAARAGVCRKLAQLTLRMVARDGLVTVERRPRPGRKNLSNIVRIISADWLAWLKHGGRSERRAIADRQGFKIQGEKISLPRTPDLEKGKRGYARKESALLTVPIAANAREARSRRP